MTIDKTFDPAAIEARWYPHWETNGRFRPERPDADPFTIVIPPPNVTGSLHIGHALDVTLQDILVRHARLKGKDALWVVGTDHAGIATQMVVERNLASEGLTRADMGREAFVDRIWDWKAESGGAITSQLRRIGVSCDWANERFTMDEGFSRAVTRVFVDLHEQGLLYRDKRLVNWDPHFKTAISDLEVEQREVNGHFWHLRYPLEDGSGFVSVATTRPETMLADMAVAVNPQDARYQALIGRKLRLPITGRLIPIIADDHADPELGSGAVKITPGHDFNDFEVGKRAGIKAADMLNMLDAAAAICQTADGLIPADLIGMDRVSARAAIVRMLDQAGALERIEDRAIQQPFGDRSGVVIEPWLTEQWYVDAATLAAPALEAVRSGAIRVVPETWKKTYYHWLENIQPWCVSRQLWWGHQIPAWYDAAGNVYVAEDEAAAQVQAGGGVALTRDADVLDTWFSSALWPFGTLGWPEDTAKLRRHYPLDVLISGFDILFFWDARMVMQGLHFMNEVPFKTLYLHGLVRDANGAKMSKSKGNTVDPIGLIDRYGADALRFTLAAMESQGRDIKLDEKRVEGYRNFATKLWNAARFAQANGIGASTTIDPPAADLAVNRWIIAETVRTVQALDLALADLRYDEAANTIYHFVWASFCDWYLELIKPVLQGEGAEGGEETRAVAGWVLDQILIVLHPFMPFVTEELWHATGDRSHDLILARWPMVDARALDPAAAEEIEWLIKLVSEIRTARAELNVPPGARLPAFVRDCGAATLARLERNAPVLARLARIDGVSADAPPPGCSAQLVVGEATYILPLEGVIDLAAERARLLKGAETAEKERDALAKRLGSPGFVEKAKPEAIEKARADHDERSADAARLRAALARLG
ncbi:MAG: valyl-tRNA synthetase [Sphingomonas bacterium]|nr:valine--tRNA ligase [Sphingomonas bacterium]MDB5688690.1 valyl-tRNA synthetase [Sphingomonas bacterium]